MFEKLFSSGEMRNLFKLREIHTMYKKLATISALTLLLAACDTCEREEPTTCAEGEFAPGSYGDFIQNAGNNVYFALNSSQLSTEARATIERQANWLKQWGDRTVSIEGHCDERGTSEYNLALGERRANSDAKALMSNGIASGRISTVSYGKERPADPGHNEAAWQQNRRATTVVNQ